MATLMFYVFIAFAGNQCSDMMLGWKDNRFFLNMALKFERFSRPQHAKVHVHQSMDEV